MKLLNRVSLLFGIRVSRRKPAPAAPKGFRKQYEHHLSSLEKNSRGFSVLRKFRYDVGIHPANYRDFECSFASQAIAEIQPSNILDVGSYRHFILGLLANYRVTTLDIREREPASANETVLTHDAKELKIASESFDTVVSLCALEHFGLGRYGDDFDLDADVKAFMEMRRVLKPGGALVFTTSLTRATPSIAFNAHRIYNYEMIEEFCEGLTKGAERYFSRRMNRPCRADEITDAAGVWDVYCGYWLKK